MPNFPVLDWSVQTVGLLAGKSLSEGQIPYFLSLNWS